MEDGEEDGEWDSFLLDTDSSWLETWWACNAAESCSTMKDRITEKRRNRRDLHIKRGDSSRAHILPISVVQFVNEESLDKDIYNVALSDCKQGLGLTLNIMSSGAVIVVALKSLPNGELSPTQRCGMIRAGDHLIKINDCHLETMEFLQIAQLVTSLDRLGKVRNVYTVYFVFITHPTPPTPSTPSIPSPELRSSVFQVQSLSSTIERLTSRR